MTDFLETPRFPQCPSFGYRALPDYSVQINQRGTGREKRNAAWAEALRRIEVTVGPRAEADVAELLEFWHAVGGREVGFRFKDWSDFKSCRAHEDVTPTDQPMGQTTGSPTLHRLVKVYAVGILTRNRRIEKPVQGTIRIADGGTEKTEGVDWSLDYATGVVTLNFAPVGALTWGGEFDVPVRFDSDFPVELLDKEIQSVTVALQEIRPNDDE